MSVLKKPKIEKEDLKYDEEGTELYSSREDQEEALVALIEHRSKEVEQHRRRILYYQSQLDDAEKKLEESKLHLARLRTQSNETSSRKISFFKSTEVVRRLPNPVDLSEDSSSPPHQLQPKPLLVLPAVNMKNSQSSNTSDTKTSSLSGSGSRSSTSTSTHVDSLVKVKREKPDIISIDPEPIQAETKTTKRKIVEKEDTGLIALIASCSSPKTITCQRSSIIPSQHKRKLRNLVLCPTDNKLFVTSALDGIVNLWKLQNKGTSANLVSSSDCLSIQRKWPEDMAWHPHGNTLFSVYNADAGESQISVLDFNKKSERKSASYLESKPHVKGIINSIAFTPWEDTCFVTGGSDHGVVLWTEKNSWKTKVLHKNIHSSAVMGVLGVYHKQSVMSVGMDKRIIGYDLAADRVDYKHVLGNKCMDILQNPRDFNLFMVQTGTPEKQIRLFDLRIKEGEIHAFGWKQESSEAQSALINQAWSPDGLYLTSGSVDPVIHIFDIRYSAHKPSQSISAHHKRVFRAVWHSSYPLLISISSDLNIGLHKIS